MITKQPIAKRISRWVNSHRVIAGVALVMAIAIIASISTFAVPYSGARPGIGNGDSKPPANGQGPYNGARPGIGGGDNEQRNGSGSGGGSNTNASAKQKDAARKAKKKLSEAKAKAAKAARNASKKEQILVRLQGQFRTKCGILAISDSCQNLAKKVKKAEQVNNKAKANLQDKAKQLNAASRQCQKVHCDRKGSNGGGSGSGSSSGGSSVGGSSGSSGGSGGSSGGSGSSNSKQVKAVGSIQVTVLKQRPGKNPIKLGKVRVSVKPKCKAALKRTGPKGVATFAGCKAGKHVLTVHPPKGYRTVSGKATQTVTVKGKKQRKVKFVLKQTVIASPTPTPKVTVSTTPTPAASSEPTDIQPDEPTDTTSDASELTADSGGIKGALPTTGQAAVATLIAVLVLSGAYYGFRYYRHRKQL